MFNTLIDGYIEEIKFDKRMFLYRKEDENNNIEYIMEVRLMSQDEKPESVAGMYIEDIQKWWNKHRTKKDIIKSKYNGAYLVYYNFKDEPELYEMNYLSKVTKFTQDKKDLNKWKYRLDGE